MLLCNGNIPSPTTGFTPPDFSVLEYRRACIYRNKPFSFYSRFPQYLFMLLHGGIELLRQVIGHVWHAGLLLVSSADAALILVGFFVVLFLGILAVALAPLQ